MILFMGHAKYTTCQKRVFRSQGALLNEFEETLVVNI